MVGLNCDGHGCGGSISGISARLFLEILVVRLDEVPHVSCIIVIYAHKVPVWVRCVL